MRSPIARDYYCAPKSIPIGLGYWDVIRAYEKKSRKIV